MSLREVHIYFIQCDMCGDHAPVATDRELAYDHASEQSWKTNPDLCETCAEKVIQNT